MNLDDTSPLLFPQIRIYICIYCFSPPPWSWFFCSSSDPHTHPSLTTNKSRTLTYQHTNTHASSSSSSPEPPAAAPSSPYRDFRAIQDMCWVLNIYWSTCGHATRVVTQVCSRYLSYQRCAPIWSFDRHHRKCPDCEASSPSRDG